MKPCSRCKKNPRAVSRSGRTRSLCHSCDQKKSRLYYERKVQERGKDFVRHKNVLAFEARRRRLGYDTMYAAQDGVCAICRQPETKMVNGKVRRLCIDHDHKTGLVRRLLCNDCNYGLGCFKDDPALLEAAIAYLRTHERQDAA